MLTLTLSCPNRPGIVAAVASALHGQGGDIREAQQYDDAETGRFFMRVLFTLLFAGEDTLHAALAPIAARFGMDWAIRSQAQPRRVLILVSKFDHCAADLMYRWRIDELRMQPVAIVSNHPIEALPALDLAGVPFHHLRGAKTEIEQGILDLVETTGAELVVLARYMQVLSDHLAGRLAGRCINIHHSFLPGFKGARPYHQAHARGVKLIGASAHYVTAALDEGPIIEQDVERISHRDTPEDLVRKGRDIERRVLARAVRAHLEDRVLINGSKTVVFEG